MSADDEDVEIPGREIAYRLFAAEYDDASVSYAESDEERAPNYVIAPTGARLNRLFAVGTLTEVTRVNEDMVRARVVDPTGAFVVYAGQYQPDELAVLESLEPPAFVAVTGKARTFQPDDSDRVYTSIRPESIATVDADTRDRWVVSAAEQTLERVGTYAAAAELEGSAEPRRGNSGSSRPLEDEVFQDSADSRAATPRDLSGEELTDALLEAGVDSGLAAGIPLAQDNYGTTPSYLAALRDCALEAVEVVAGDRDQVTPFDAQPDQSSPAYESATFDSLTELADVELDALEATAGEGEGEPEPVAATPDASDTAGTDSVETSTAAGTATGTDRASAGDVDAEADADDDGSRDTEASGLEVESESESETEPEAGPADAGAADAASGSVDDSESESESESETDLESEPTATFDEGDAAAESESEPEFESDAGDESAADADTEDDRGDFDGDAGMYEMDDDEREQLEEQFGAEFTTGSEVEEPGETGIDVEVSEPDDAGTDAGAETGDTVDDELGAPPESGLEADDSASESEPDAELESEPEPELEADESADNEAEPEADTDEDEPELEADEPAGADESDAEDDEPEDADAPADDVDLQDYVVETMADLDDGDGADRSELIETVASDTGASEDEVEDAIQDALMGGQCYEPDDETLKPI